MALRLKLFGHLQAAEGEGSLALRLRPRAQRLLAYLVLHDAPLTRESAAFHLWPDQPEPHAVGNLRRALSELRSALPDPGAQPWILATRDALRWNPDAALWLDLRAFERLCQAGSLDSLQEAAGLYTDDLLAGWYDEWILPERERLQQMLSQALQQLIPLLEARHDYRAAIGAAERLLRLDPLREESYRQLMHLHASNGDRTGAVRTFHACAAVLKQELDVAVGGATRALFERIVQAADAPAPTPPASPSGHSLPFPITTFIGREREIAAVRQLLGQRRLLTLTGPGGCGKTRLALQAAGEMAVGTAGGVWLVELASLPDPALLPQAVASALGVHEQPGRALPDTLVDFLRPKEALLILDNCEHLLQACSQLAETLLRSCAGLRVLATSRERLKVPGETVWPVPSLSLPGSPQPDALDAIGRSEAVRLFVDRAAAVLPTFELSQRNAEAVVHICRRLDGIPLAIELAAARVRMFAPAELAAHLEGSLRLLADEGSAAPPRHQTLRAAMDWSYDLLSENERALFRRLSVFVGGWTLEAAGRVASGGPVEDEEGDPEAVRTGTAPGEALELLSQLIDKSLVVAEVQTGEARYRMLETVRQYARDRLLDCAEDGAAQSKFARFYLEFAEAAAPELKGAEQVAWAIRLEAEHDNLRAALRWMLNERQAGPALRLVLALSFFWRLRDYFSEGRDWTGRVVALASPEANLDLRARALNSLVNFSRALGDYPAAQRLAETNLALFRELNDTWGIADTLMSMGLMAWHQSDYPEAQSLFERSLVLFREAGDPAGVADVLHHLGHVTLDQGGHDQARTFFTDSLRLFRETGNRDMVAILVGDLGLLAYVRREFAAARAHFEESLVLHRETGSKGGIGKALNRLGDLARCQGDDDRAERLYEEGLALLEEIGEKSPAASTLQNLGYIALHRGDAARAAARFEDSLRSFQHMGDVKGVAECFMGMAGVLCARGEHRQAVRLLGLAEALRESVGVPLWPANQIEYDRSLAALRALLDEDALAAAWAEGRAMTAGQAIDGLAGHPG